MKTIKINGVNVEIPSESGIVFEYDGSWYQDMQDNTAIVLCTIDEFTDWKTPNPDKPYPAIKK